MDNIQVDQNSKFNKKKKSKLSSDNTDAGPSDNSIEHSDTTVIKPKKSFWKNIFRFKSRKQEIPESVVTDMRRGAMKVPHLDTIFEERDDAEMSESGSKDTEKTDTSAKAWIPLKNSESSKVESTTEEYLEDESLSSEEEEITREKIILPEGNADKILKEIQAQMKKSKPRKQHDTQKQEPDQAITKEEYSFEYSGSSGQSLDDEEKTKEETTEEIQVAVPCNEPLSTHPSNEVVDKISEKKVTFLPEPYDDVPVIPEDTTLFQQVNKVLSEDLQTRPERRIEPGYGGKLDTETPEGSIATVESIQLKEQISTSKAHSSPSPSAPREQSFSQITNEEEDIQERKVEESSSANKIMRIAPFFNNNYNTITHVTSPSTSSSNEEDTEDEDWRYMYEDIDEEDRRLEQDAEHRMYVEMAKMKGVQSSDSMNEIEVWSEDLNEFETNLGYVTTAHSNIGRLPTYEQVEASEQSKFHNDLNPISTYDFQKVRDSLTFQEYCNQAILPEEIRNFEEMPNDLPDKTYSTLNEQKGIFSKSFMYNFHAETRGPNNFQAPSTLELSFRPKEGREELPFDTKKMEEKGDIRLDKFFKMVFDHASQDYTVVYDPIPSELPENLLQHQATQFQGDERCKVTRKRKIISLLQDKRLYDEYLKEFEATEPINVEATNRDSKINLLLLDGSGTQISSFGRSVSNTSTHARQRYGRHDLSPAGSEGAGPSRWYRPTKSLDDLRRFHKYFVPYNSPAGLSTKNSRAPDLIGIIDEASGSTLVSTSSLEEPGIATVLENTRKKLITFISNHNQRSSAEQLNSLYPNNYLERFNVISSSNTVEDEDEIDQISLDSIMSGFDHYDASQNHVEQLTSVCSTEAYHKEKVDTYDTVELDVRILINELLVKVDELKEDCIAAGVDRKSNGSLFGDITAKLSGAVVQNVLEDILNQTFKVIEAKNTNVSPERLKAGQSKSAITNKLTKSKSNDRNTKNQDADGDAETNEDDSGLVNVEASVDNSATVEESSKLTASSSFSFDSEFGDLKDQPTTISIVTNSDKPPFLKNHCTLKEGLQKTAGFLTSIYSELCEYNPVSYLMHQSITVKLDSEPVDIQEPEPGNEQLVNAEAPVASEDVKTNTSEMQLPDQDELLEEAAGYSEYYSNKIINVQDSEQDEHVISIQTNEHFVINQVNLEDPQPQQSSWAPKCVKVTKDFKYLDQDKNAIKPTEKFRFVSAKDDSEIEQKLIYAFDGSVPGSELNVSFLDHEHNTGKKNVLQDANIEIINVAPTLRGRRESVAENRPQFDSESDQRYRFPTEHSKDHTHVKFTIPEMRHDIPVLETDELLEFTNDVDDLFGFRYMDTSADAFAFTIISTDSQPNGVNQAAFDSVQKNADQTDTGTGKCLSESSSFFTHTFNTAESFVKRLENEINTMKLELPLVVQAGEKTQTPGPSSITILMPKQFSAGSDNEEASSHILLTALHQDIVNLSGSSSEDNGYDFNMDDDILVTATQSPNHLQLERKAPELDLQTVDKDVHEKIEEDLRSVEESIHKIMDLNKKTIDIMNSTEIPSSDDSSSILSTGGLVQSSSVEKTGAEHGNCDQTTINKLDAPMLDSFQPPLNPVKSLTITSPATTGSIASLNVKESFEQSVAMSVHRKKGPISKVSQEEIDAILRKYNVHKELSEDDFIAQAKQIREDIQAKLKKLRDDSQERQKIMHAIQDKQNAVKQVKTLNVKPKVIKQAIQVNKNKSKGEVVAIEKIKLQKGLSVDLKNSKGRNDLSKSSILQVQTLDSKPDQSKELLKRSQAEKNLVEATVMNDFACSETPSNSVHQSRKDEIANNLKKCEKLLQNVFSPTLMIEQPNSCFCVGTKVDELCSGMGRLCVSPEDDEAPKHFNFGLRRSQIFKGELDRKVKVSFGESPSTSSATSEPSTSFCRNSCEDRSKLRRPIEKAIEE